MQNEDDSSQVSRKRISPSAYMRQLRPGNYSDTEERTGYALDEPVLSHHLENITARNQTHDFEIFCRKICERTVCPNLRPQTGPDGGGDSKADTETIPVADEIAIRSYIGTPNAGSERWAFAFSAKEDWKSKAKSDVQGIAETNRGYKRIIFVTSRNAKAKARAALEQELTLKYGVDITIHDRSWIITQVIEHDCKDIAFNYLHVGQAITDPFRLGPSDYSRSRQLDALEKSLRDTSAFEGMKVQEVTEAILAVELSRNLERPRIETDGRIARAVRLADLNGTFRQRLETRYQRLWTAVWWFDDLEALNSGYAEIEGMALPSNSAANLEFLSNLLQMLFNAVMHGDYQASDCDLELRSKRLLDRLAEVAADRERPNNALDARTLLALGRINVAMLSKDEAAVAELWPELSTILSKAEGLGEFDATRFVRLIEVFGQIAGDNADYNRLVEEVASFVSSRRGEAEGALVLLSRAKQLDFDNHFDMIRLLGKAARQLSKREYAEELIETTQLLGMAYRSAGLHWASRASLIFAAAAIVIEGELDSEIPIALIPTLTTLCWVSLELRYIPDVLAIIQILNACHVTLPLTEKSKETLKERLQEFDLALASNILNFTAEELEELIFLPDLLESLGLYMSRTALLYVLGHEDALRADGSLPSSETDKSIADMMMILASQPVSDSPVGQPLFNTTRPQHRESVVLGMKVLVRSSGSETSILVAEAVLASIEACFATAFEMRVHPHTEQITIEIIEDSSLAKPTFDIDDANLTASLKWPAELLPAPFSSNGDCPRELMIIATTVMMATCGVRDVKATLDRLMGDEAVMDRIAMIAVSSNSHHRVFSTNLSRFADWSDHTKSEFSLRQDRPLVQREKIPIHRDEAVQAFGPRTNKDGPWGKSTSHRDVEVRSLIDINLWNRAGWMGAAYIDGSPQVPPAIALLMKNEDAARNIFRRWNERLGRIDEEEELYLAIITDVDDAYPHHYTMQITSTPPSSEDAFAPGGLMMVSRMHRMQAETNANLTRFIMNYLRTGAYLLLPAIWLGSGEPTPLYDMAIMKRRLNIISATEVSQTRPEWAAVQAKFDS